MKKKNLRPQQVAPVQRETNATSSVGEKSMAAAKDPNDYEGWRCLIPFAGDDAE